MSTFRDCSGHHLTSYYQWNVVGFSAKLASFCGHTLEKCPNCNRKHTAFSNQCTKKAEATRVARENRIRGRQASMNAVTDVASETDRVVLGPPPLGDTEEGE